ncbi:MAG: BCCT family transporter [Candidatus Pararuminococcus gallinarum]|jgi:glycine betaine transporter
MGERKRFKIEKGTFIPTSIILLLLVFIGFVFPAHFRSASVVVLHVLTNNFGWLILAMSAIMLFLCFGIAVTPFAKNTIIGGADAKPEYSVFSWCAMTVCSAIATAMVFWAVAEPMNHFMNPPVFTGTEAGTPEAAVRAIQIATFHMSYVYYGLYTFWGIACGYLCLNKRLPFRPCTALYPIFKEKTYGWIGKVIDVLSIVGLVGGIVTSLGLGTTQFTSGLQFLFGIQPSNTIFAVSILLVTFCYTLSSLRGVSKGMKLISDLNSYIYIVFLAFLLIAGPTVFQLDLLTESIGSYVTNFFQTAFNTDTFRIGGGWVQNWTIFDMVWYLAYAPCIGLFLAKISKGRTMRSFILVNLLIPGTFVFLWLTFWGGNAFYQSYFLGADIWGTIQEFGNSIANFALLDLMPFKTVTIPLLIACLFFSFITLADAMTGTIASITLKNASPEEAPSSAKLYWGIIIGLATLICLFALGEVGTTALQSFSVALGLPLFFLSIPLIIVCLRLPSGKVDRMIDSLEKKRENEETVETDSLLAE